YCSATRSRSVDMELPMSVFLIKWREASRGPIEGGARGTQMAPICRSQIEGASTCASDFLLRDYSQYQKTLMESVYCILKDDMIGVRCALCFILIAPGALGIYHNTQNV